MMFARFRRASWLDLRALCAALLAVALLLPAAGAAGAATFEALSIRTAKGTVDFKVEVAQTDAERERGLMYRTELKPDTGMLFDFKLPQPVYMWMKNTYIPLDMVFIAADGRIANIAENTTPLSTDVIASDGQVRAVLELAGGTARAKGIAVGDRVRYRLFPEK
ncbi:DUF192 domain-containing protein [Ancylobacter lacus]|uniref:DUF192 domain-containing protein n=1 Tax=Ancylobacter lacus TaxID=2579970 RepID=UPI001FE7A1F7|nr:DUF192 domain-containing protein [Ancylobacter lacus]